MKKFLLLVFFTAIFNLFAEETGSIVNKFPVNLINASGKKVNAASALKGKMVAVYFSASWCGPCRGFTPQLVKFYKKVKKSNAFEIVFVSSDKTPQDMKKYMKDDAMPWLAVPFNDPAVKKFRNEAGVNGIPQLTIYDKNGKIISQDGRWDVVMLGDKALGAWKSPKYKPLTFEDYKKKLASGTKKDNGKKSSKKSSKKSNKK